MKTQRSMRIIKAVVALNLIILAVLVTPMRSVRAGELSNRHWRLWLGGGALVNPVYPGSDTLYVSPIPYVDAEYTTRYVDFLAGIEDGIGLRVKAPDYSDVSLTLAINPLGVKRDPKLKTVEDFILHDADEIKQFLDGTPTVESPIELFGTIELDLSFAKVSSTATFLPITADYKQTNLADKDYTGLTVSLDVESGLPLTPQIFLQGRLGATWMNDDYATAFHGVDYPTNTFKVFNAQSGMNDAHATVELVSFFTAHIGAIVSGSATLLLSDAADSPLTKETFQPEVAALVFYSF